MPTSSRCFRVALRLPALALLAAAFQLPLPASVTGQPAAPCTIGHLGVLSLEPPALERDAPSVSRANLEAWVRAIAAPFLRGRPGGSPEAARVAVLLANELAALGYQGPLHGGDLCQLFPIPYSGPDHNVIGVLGDPTDHTRPVVLVMAHYDSLGVEPRSGAIFAGAHDNASGLAALLEVARLAAADSEPWPFNLVILAPGAQLHGLYGSRYFVESPPFPLAALRLVIELDAVGRPLLDGLWSRTLLGDPEDTVGYSTGAAGALAPADLVQAAAAETGIRVMGVPQEVLSSLGFFSDIVSFAALDVATLVLSSGGGDLHSVHDTADRVDYGQVERAALLVFTLLRHLRAQWSP
jgi:hypothetical protein